jgi:PAS domain S-box-containing protein
MIRRINRSATMPDQPTEMLVPVGALKAAAWFFDNSLDTFMTIQGDRIDNVNATWTRLTGWDKADTRGRAFWSFVHPEDVDPARSALAGLTVGERGVYEHRLSTPGGDWLWARSHVIMGEDGWVLVIVRDITEERRREADANEARHAASMLRGAAGVSIWRYDPDSDRYQINPDFARPAGQARPRLEVEGDRIRPTVHRADAPALHMAWTRSIATGEAHQREYRERAKDGSWRRTRVAWQGARRMPSGRWEIIGIAQDVTELTVARDMALRGEEAARQAGTAKSQFLANMSHEIRTPMNGVLGILHLLKAEPSAQERSRLIDEALRSGANLSSLLNDIIDYADIESGRLVLAREATDPRVQLTMVLDLLRPCAEAKGLSLEADCGPGIEAVAADPGRLRQMFLHLVGNAVKFTQTGSVKVRLTAAGDGEARRLRLEVEDTGVGIPREAQAGLFERFSQVDNSTTRQFGGGGLGLTITQHLAQLMDGKVGFRSTLGQGSTFWLDVAAPSRAGAEGDAAEAEEEGVLSGVRALVVEDNPTNRLVVTGMLGQLGADVETAENGAEGVAAVERGDFDVIFMDIQMPVMDGMEATRRIRAMASPKCDVPIVATTANVMPAQLAAYRQCGVSGVVAKPISPAALLAEVSRIAGCTDEDALALAG